MLPEKSKATRRQAFGTGTCATTELLAASSTVRNGEPPLTTNAWRPCGSTATSPGSSPTGRSSNLLSAAASMTDSESSSSLQTKARLPSGVAHTATG